MDPRLDQPRIVLYPTNLDAFLLSQTHVGASSTEVSCIPTFHIRRRQRQRCYQHLYRAGIVPFVYLCSNDISGSFSSYFLKIDLDRCRFEADSSFSGSCSVTLTVRKAPRVAAVQPREVALRPGRPTLQECVLIERLKQIRAHNINNMCNICFWPHSVDLTLFRQGWSFHTV